MGSFASFRQTISARLILLVTVVAAPLVGIQVYHAIVAAEPAHREALDHSLQTARTVLGRIDDHVRNVDALLVTVAVTVPPRRDALDQGNATLRRIKASLPAYFGSISVLEADGNMLYSAESPQPRPGSLNVADRGYVKEARASGALAIGDPVRSRTSGKWIQVLARPVRDGDTGPIAGVVSASTLLERFQAIFAEVKLAASIGNVWDWNVLTNGTAFPQEFWLRLGYEECDVGNTAAMFESILHPDDRWRWQQLTVGREERMLQLKAEVNELLARLGEAARYSGGGES